MCPTNLPIFSFIVVRVISPFPVATAMILGLAGQYLTLLIYPECWILLVTVILWP